MSTAMRLRLSGRRQKANPVTSAHYVRCQTGGRCSHRILASTKMYEEIQRQLVDALPNETGGFLLGRVSRDVDARCWHIAIEEAFPMSPIRQTPLGFAFTWRDVERVRDYREKRFPIALTGWYHSHPGCEIFLSKKDFEETHRILFPEPFQVALVSDPLRRRARYFYWEGKEQMACDSCPEREFALPFE